MTSRARALVTTVLAVVLAALTPAAPAAAAAGTLSTPDGALFPGCHAYPYGYALTPPTPYWTLETFLVGPDGTQLASAVFVSQSDSAQAASTFGVCSSVTSRGTFRIEAMFTSYPAPGSPNGTVEQLPPVQFRLGQPGSATALSADDLRPRRGQVVRFRIVSERDAPGVRVANDIAAVVLQRRMATGWRRVPGARAETNDRGVARVRVRWSGGRERYRAITARSADCTTSVSPAIALRTVR
ncbi:MAG: hypothetical protein ACR2JD_05610 [Nocardioides sp.]